MVLVSPYNRSGWGRLCFHVLLLLELERGGLAGVTGCLLVFDYLAYLVACTTHRSHSFRLGARIGCDKNVSVHESYRVTHNGCCATCGVPTSNSSDHESLSHMRASL